MPERSAEGDVLTSLCLDINYVLKSHLDSFADAVVSAGFVPQSTVSGIMSKHGTSAHSQAGQIMEAVRNIITTQSTTGRITEKFDQFVILLHDIRLDELSELLIEERSKCF